MIHYDNEGGVFNKWTADDFEIEWLAKYGTTMKVKETRAVTNYPVTNIKPIKGMLVLEVRDVYNKVVGYIYNTMPSLF